LPRHTGGSGAIAAEIRERGEKIMNRGKSLYGVCLSIGLLPCPGWAQASAPVVLRVDVENAVNYWTDVSDVSKLAIDTHSTTGISRVAFETVSGIYDIVAVNGKPVKGTVAWTARNLNLIPNRTPGQGIADVARNGLAQYSFEFLQPDGTSMGAIMVQSFNGGSPPPGSPIANGAAASQAIIGGTGAFLGTRGQSTQGAATVAVRQASMSEDPAERRINGGGKTQFILQLVPEERPQVVMTANGPAIVHTNTNQLVTAANPAHAGETLTLYATGLGPVKAVEIGQPFPASPPAPAVAPVEITVNGTAASVSYAGGYPGAVDGYQVNFTLPSGIASGMGNLQLSAAWIPGSAVALSLQ
jgi:uncharacterized protein (TIGR03437 family)